MEPTPRAVPSVTGDRPRVWPLTAALVLGGWLLLAWDVFAAAINTAPFFGDIPSRDRYAESAGTLLTALLPVALLCAVGLAFRCRYGLLALALPAVLVGWAGADFAGRTGDPADPHPDRPLSAADLVSDLTRLNWVTSGALALGLAVLATRRVRAARRSRTAPVSGSPARGSDSPD